MSEEELIELLKDARTWLEMYLHERTIKKHSEKAFRLGVLCGRIDKALEKHKN